MTLGLRIEMGFVPPKTPERPDWMDDATWHRLIGHELRRMKRLERANYESCVKMLVICLVELVIAGVVVWLF